MIVSKALCFLITHPACWVGHALGGFSHVRKVSAWFLLFFSISAATLSAQQTIFGFSFSDSQQKTTDCDVKFNEICVDFISFVEAEYNDNINASGVAPRSDLIMRFGFDVSGSMLNSSLSWLNLRLAASYDYYLSNSELNSLTNSNFLTITPDSSISLRARVGNFYILFRDQIGFSFDPTDSAFLDPETSEVRYDVLQYGRLTNNAGLTVDWDMHLLNAQLGAYRKDVFVLNDDLKFTERTQSSLNGMLRTFLSRHRMTLGIHGAYTWNEYDNLIQNNSDGFSWGIFANWQATEFMRLSFNTRWSVVDFETSGLINDSSDLDDVNYALSVQHTLNRHFNHELTLSRATRFGFVSNTTTIDQLRYDFRKDRFLFAPLTGSIAWQDGQDSGGIDPETYDRWDLELGTGEQLTSRLSWRLSYHHRNKSSSIAIRSFTQNRLLLRFTYDF